MSRQKYGDTFYVAGETERRRVRTKRIVLFLLLLAVAVIVGGALAWFLKRKSSHEPHEKEPLNCTAAGARFDCSPDDTEIDKAACTYRGCCFSADGKPRCFFPSSYDGYAIAKVSRTPEKMTILLQRGRSSGFPRDVQKAQVVVTFIDDGTLRIKVTDVDSLRFEVPIPLYYQIKYLKEPSYEVVLDEQTTELVVRRKSSGIVVFRTLLSQMVFSDQFLQLSSTLPSKYIYGIGEHYGGIQRNVNWTRYTLLNSDLSPIPNHALYGSHPFYLALEKGGGASGVFLLNSNFMDVLLQPAPAVTFRSIGGIFDFFLMLGPSPKDVATQYAGIVGRTFMPPFWSLGFHLCRYGYGSLENTRKTMQKNLDAGVPVDVQWNDIDYMEQYKDFTYDKGKFAGLPAFVDELHKRGMHYMVIVDPGISNSEKTYYPPYDEGVVDDIFVKNSSGEILVGKVWTDGTTVYPDFSHPASTAYWTRQFRRFHDQVKFDGAWIDMNEPSNFYNGSAEGCTDSKWDNPPYIPGGNLLYYKTLCLSAKHYYSTHYNEHNLYAYREAVATYEALVQTRRKRPFIISRASFSGQGVYGGHWSGDIGSTWENLRYSIPSLINFNMYGVPMIGSDICGFNGNATPELCARWQALGAFYPFSRNHNDRPSSDQDPATMGGVVLEATLSTLKKRYALLPFLYTLFYKSHAFGDTVVRPLFFEFPRDENTYSIDEQFLWGPSLLITPGLYPNTSKVAAYFPDGVWYDMAGTRINGSGHKLPLEVPLTDIHLSARGGHILPMIVANRTTTLMRRNPFILLVALDEKQQSSGELYWDDGDSLETFENGFYNLVHFDAKPGSLESNVSKIGYPTDMNLTLIHLAGLDDVPKNVTVNGEQCSTQVDLKVSLNDSAIFEEFEKFGIFGIEPRHFSSVNDSVLEGATCMAFKLKNLVTIYTESASLLSPLSVLWS